MSTISIATAVIKLLPHISDTIRAVEELDATPGKGLQKQAVVLAIIKGVYEAINPGIPFDDAKSTVEKIINAVVDFYNSIGVFKKAVAA